ncbi:hypothetical protein TSAR_013513 [Trichomalopsis sarcophagae]|uniref:Uncharacterized protein n=1 Tax=Trichomalopsis sarcophagae TaxID=543379 RepID=A0A232FHB5_9HYME|nr:hypothetical protein TSAR_013513 [Trichomalopsis sarcophagae]
MEERLAVKVEASQKLNLSSSPHRRRRSGDENAALDEQAIYPNGYAAMLLKSPPPAPPALLRRIGVKELSGVGKAISLDNTRPKFNPNSSEQTGGEQSQYPARVKTNSLVIKVFLKE